MCDVKVFTFEGKCLRVFGRDETRYPTGFRRYESCYVIRTTQLTSDTKFITSENKPFFLLLFSAYDWKRDFPVEQTQGCFSFVLIKRYSWFKSLVVRHFCRLSKKLIEWYVFTGCYGLLWSVFRKSSLEQ